jgi:hypothetical protein
MRFKLARNHIEGCYTNSATTSQPGQLTGELSKSRPVLDAKWHQVDIDQHITKETFLVSITDDEQRHFSGKYKIKNGNKGTFSGERTELFRCERTID